MVKSKNTSKELLFNEFLNEEALQPKKEVEVALEITKTESVSYKIPTASAATEDEIKNQWRSIRNFFRTAEKSKSAESSLYPIPHTLYPILMAPYLTNEELATDYPIFLSEENETEHASLAELLDRSFRKTFKQGEAAILFKNLRRIENSVRKYVANANNFCTLTSALDPAFSELSKIKVNGEDGINFLKDLDKFKNNFPKAGKILGFSQQTPIRLLAHLLKNQSLQKRKNFIADIHRLKSGLKDLLTVSKSSLPPKRGDTAAQIPPFGGGGAFGFADSLIEFKKLDTLKPASASESMPKKRAERIMNCVQILETAEKLLVKQAGVVYIGKALSENPNFKWKELLPGLDIKIASANEICSSASEGFKTHIAPLAKLMASARIAALELEGKYDEDIHGDYFSRFNWHYFSEAETALCPPVVLMEETQNLLGKDLPHFSALIASNKPVKALAINKPTPFKINKNGHESDELLAFQQELSALAISHRNAFTLQSAVHNPLHLLNGYAAGLDSSAPALFHVLFSSNLYPAASRNFLEISAAVEGRQFPLFTYNAKGENLPEGRHGWGSRFDISANPQPDKNWPVYSFEVKNEKGETENMDLAFTFADFFATGLTQKNVPTKGENFQSPFRDLGQNLLIVPPFCWSDDLIPMSEYMALSSDKLYSKVPFVWLADNENKLHKAAVPYSLVIASKERLDFWNFIQELGGINSFHVEQAVNHTRSEMQEQKEREIKEIETKFEKQIEEVRSNAAGEAMNKLAGILLDLDSISTSHTTQPSLHPSPSLPTREGDALSDSPPSGELEGAVISNEPWIETFRCTSCNECTDKYPRAFKYDGEKQAYIEDATTVTFAQIVKAAEVCPAKCIHPGTPLNPNEPGLEDLIARAKPFNT